MSLSSRIPYVVQRVMAKDAACATTHFCVKGEDPVSVDVQCLLDEEKPGAAHDDSASWRLLYDVMKVEHQRVMFEEPHVRRIAESYHTVTGHRLPAASEAHIRESIRRYIAAVTRPDSPAQNVKFVSWLARDPETGAARLSGDGSDKFAFVLMFMKSFFPPAEWYTTGTTQALLFDARRENPNAKVVQAGLRARATAAQEEVGVFEVLLVHGAEDNHLIPEGSRSNYLLVDRDDDRLLCSAEEDILVGITLSAARRAAVRAGLGAVHHQRLYLGDICHSRSLIMLGTSIGTLPVRELVLYWNEESKSAFEAVARHAGVVIAEAPGFHKVSDNPPKASLLFDVGNDVVRRLIEGYREEAFS